MQRRKAIVLAAAVGAGGGAAAAWKHLGGRIVASFPALGLDKAVLAHEPFLLAACIPWVVQGLYWEHAAKSAAAAKSSENKVSRAFHVFLANLAAVLVLLPVRGLGRFLPVSAAIMAAGIVVEGLGLFLAIRSRRHLGSNWSGEITIKVDHQLVRSGAYRLLRHPIYTGLLTMYAGSALVPGLW
jgi:protein-S-isoprenylcysteine O-methyltransferase Ste14